MDKYLHFFSEEEKEQIYHAIRDAESLTSGEVRVHLEDHCDHHPRDRAAFLFEKLKMHHTQNRNGVLFYISVCDRNFAVIGDIGIHDKVGEDYWRDICTRLEAQFRSGAFKEGLLLSIEQVGQVLKDHFPYDKDDVNELSDDISMGRI